MKRPEPMKNLWMKSVDGANPFFAHRLTLFTSPFVPILKGCQPLDRKTHSRVIPLPRVSY